MTDIKILIVEDELIIAKDLAQKLQRNGYIVSGIVSSGEAAIEKASEMSPDLILMDIVIKGSMDGIETASYIRDRLQIPVIYLTAYADPNTLQRAKATAPFGYILKPFKERDLYAAIEIALSRHQAELEVKKALSQVEENCQKAHQLNEQKSQYLSTASHEFRTPLSIIKFSSAFLQGYSDQLSEEKRRCHLQRIRDAADSMNDLLEDVLTLGQAEVGKLGCNPAAIDIVKFCQDLIEPFEWISGEHHLLFSSQESELMVSLDQKLIWHILNNLLSNAIKYFPQGGTVSLKLFRQDQVLYFQVHDQGIGITPEDQDRLFEPFQRAKNVGSIPGTGLGLAIVRRAVDAHGGQISVESAIGVGTTFTVSIPLAPLQ